MTHPHFLIFLLTTIYGTPVPMDIEIPIVRDHRRRAVPSVEISIEGISPSVIPLSFHFGNYTVHWGLASDGRIAGPRHTRSMQMVAHPAESVDLEWGGVNFITPSRLDISQLAIGSGSSFLSHFQSISILQNATHPVSLFLRSSQEHFERNCEPGSVINTFYNGLDLGANITFNGVDSRDVADDGVISRNHRVRLFNDTRNFQVYAILLSRELFLEVESRLRINNPRMFSEFINLPDFSYGRLQYCTHVPKDMNLTLTTYENEDGSGTRGQILLSAREFMSHDPSSHQCTFKLSGDREFSVLNPLKVSGMNMRITAQPSPDDTPGTIQFCDSSL